MSAHHLGTEHLVYAMSPDNLPVLRVQSGDTVVVETADCFENQVQSETQPFVAINWEHVNPATGPVYIEAAEPGDLLAVRIESIEPGDHGVMTTGADMGVFGDELRENTIRIVPIRDGAIALLGRSYPANPMIGVIGTAPAATPVANGTPGEHGGNMDCKLITEGATLVLPVHVPGALFALGDLHAAMGDGEVCSTGVEMPGKVTVRLKVLKSLDLPVPFLIGEDLVSAIASAATLDEAAAAAAKRMAHWIHRRSGMPLAEVAMLLSAKGDLRICQVVDPLKTVRMEFPRTWLEALRVDLQAVLD